ncbi:MAG: hypothetical protein NWE77_06635 [Candidatus Bathyarchaeota archaeon]|nr:hypothetical protein [Candidatus Bathyarchaeota archaeon]
MAKLTNTGTHNNASFGQHGGAYATGLVTIPNGQVIVAVTSLDDTTQVGNADTGYPQMGTVAIPKGVTLYGRWSSMTVAGASGKAVVYFAPED